MENYISIGKIVNFFGIKGEAKIGFSNANQIKNAKVVHLLDDPQKSKLTIKNIRFQKNFAIVKFEEIDDINELLPYKGQRLFVLKEDAVKKLEKNEFLINDLIGCAVFDKEGSKLGIVASVSSNLSQDLLNIKDAIGKIYSVPFVDEFFPEVDIKNKKIIISPIEGLLS